jgi:hypothetical protein
MSANFVITYWPFWIIGLVAFPLLVVLPQLKNIREAVEKGESDPKYVAGLFLNAKSMIISIVFGMATFVSFVLFLASVLVATVAAIKNLQTMIAFCLYLSSVIFANRLY